ncbi:XdhC family protein [Paractinoplanes lichenicola]|uniref:XdhC family protein n=1 Tax=Paractinoplanes lichenicola TaxID=2802976 RepID=A0ABS1VUM2_9ACTN|nr:XdhC family protein [Actinoplanes lichenicola]MBL7258185.1 XdhC family protein [Actinoplanes lichenicola]
MTVVERARELTVARRPFVHATVVRAQEPTSARAGDDAVILDDGSIEGFVGGVCAESSVRAAALDTLSSGKTLLLRVLPDDAASFPETPGALVVVNPCHSGGAIEIFLRPVLPKPLIGVVGDTPIGRAAAELASFLDFELTTLPSYEGVAAVVVAGRGRDEERAIRAALDAGVPYIALVASHTRGTVVLDGMGLSEDERSRVRNHAGLDIGARTPQEIALAIMAEIVRELRTKDPELSTNQSYPQPPNMTNPPTTTMGIGGAPVEGGLVAAVDLGGDDLGVGDLGGATPVTLSRSAPRRETDPVCGMTVFIDDDTPHALVDGQDFWFCRIGCRDSFVAAA